MASRDISNPQGAFGQTASFDGVFISLVAAAAITGPKAVSLATTVGQFTTAATNAPTQCIGVLVGSVGSGASGIVTIIGPAAGVPCNGTVNQFDILKPSATTAGNVASTATPAAGEALGIAMAASASNVVTMWVSKANVLS